MRNASSEIGGHHRTDSTTWDRRAAGTFCRQGQRAAGRSRLYRVGDATPLPLLHGVVHRRWSPPRPGPAEARIRSVHSRPHRVRSHRQRATHIIPSVGLHGEDPVDGLSHSAR